MTWATDLSIVTAAAFTLYLTGSLLCGKRRKPRPGGHVILRHRHDGKITYRVQLDDGARSRRYLTRRGAEWFLQRHSPKGGCR